MCIDAELGEVLASKDEGRPLHRVETMRTKVLMVAALVLAGLGAVSFAMAGDHQAARGKPPVPVKPTGQATSVRIAPPKDQTTVAWTTDVGEKYQDVSFVADRQVRVLESDSEDAKVVHTMLPLELAGVVEIKPGWAKLAGGLLKTKFTGWVPGEASQGGAFLIPRKMLDTGRLLGMLGDHPTWSVADKHLILRRAPRVGFTLEQLDLAMDKPLSAMTEETSTGVVEVRSYLDKTITITKGRVSRILTTK